jgi:hypothetical protein
MFQKGHNPLVVRTDFKNQNAWEEICEAIRAPVRDGDDTFYANVKFVSDIRYRDFSVQRLLAIVPHDYDHSFFMIVDSTSLTSPDFAVLVVSLRENRGSSFRAIPSQIQGIENNLSIANMDFHEFAESVDQDGVFRAFPNG